ncbi:hypothetical protein POTOM_059899 [Populus tomentosa]|uniref:EF-hand domain-containing protein n=1 Tax=Populus tomentosa TaxID=118781 RepID=A0A8X8BW44_POPTO|nr:hypothetical protein POTOM_059899 [Populus tomentosa]
MVIYVNRFLPSSRKHAVMKKASCDKFPRVLLFPEGTTTNGKVLISFQLGAFIPGYAIQPIIVRYPHVHFDQSWGNISLGMLMFKMFTQFHNFMEVEYLPVVSPLDNCKENPAHFAKRTSHAIASALNVVQTYHSYGDVMLLMKASESKQEKPSSYMVEMAKVESVTGKVTCGFDTKDPFSPLVGVSSEDECIHRNNTVAKSFSDIALTCSFELFHVSSLEAVDFLDKFLSMNPDASGRVKFHDFLRALRVRTCTLSEELFGFLDVEKKGSITFKQFLYGSAHVLKQPLFRQACELAFTECDTGGHGLISEQELGDTIRLAIPNLDEDEIHELFNVFDTDGDGIVSKDSFISCLRRNPLLVALFAPCLVHKDSSQGGFRMLEVV